MPKLQKILAVDPEKCTGCRLCEAACSLHQDKRCAPEKARIHVAKWETQGVYIPIICQQCDVPICETVCPMHALIRDSKTGAIIVDQNACVGCKLCAQFCPLGGIAIDEDTGKVAKCELCAGEPICVTFCEPKALQYLKATKLNVKKRREAAERFSDHFRKLLHSK